MGEGKLRRLCHFASERAVAAQDLNDAFCGQFLSHLEHTTLPNPRTVDREARKLLNPTCETVPGLPGRRSVPSYVDHWALVPAAFPQTLWAELDAY